MAKKRNRKDRKKEHTGIIVRPQAMTSDNATVEPMRLSHDYESDEPEDLREGFCPRWNCRNPDGSKVKLMDMGDYLQCGQCYRRYDKC